WGGGGARRGPRAGAPPPRPPPRPRTGHRPQRRLRPTRLHRRQHQRQPPRLVGRFHLRHRYDRGRLALGRRHRRPPGPPDGPLITNVRVTQEPPPVDKTIPAGALPASEAFYGNDRRTAADAVAYCNGAANRCTFTAEEDYSFSYYAPARVAAETYLNCTRNTLNRTRPVTTANRSYGDLPAAAGLPGSGTGAPTNMAQQYTQGTGLAPAWNTTQERSVNEIVQPA
ncbi:hypothetical protein ACFV4Q_12720, partial [Streptomyces nojiriensis]